MKAYNRTANRRQNYPAVVSAAETQVPKIQPSQHPRAPDFRGYELSHWIISLEVQTACARCAGKQLSSSAFDAEDMPRFLWSRSEQQSYVVSEALPIASCHYREGEVWRYKSMLSLSRANSTQHVAIQCQADLAGDGPVVARTLEKLCRVAGTTPDPTGMRGTVR